MFDNFILLLLLILLFIAVFCIFNARGIVKNKTKNYNINKIVLVVKILATIVAIGSLVAIYFIK